MDTSRRKFLRFAAGTAIAGAGLTGLAAAHADDLPRPPGALTEPEFLARCRRCMRCVDACQPAALKLGHIGNGMANIGTPVLIIEKCIQCLDCIRACPSGALAKVGKKELRMGVAVINQAACVTYQNKRRCKTCMDVCNREGKAIKLEKKRYPVIDATKCTGCGACLRRCPEQQNGAITIDVSKIKRFDPPAEKVLASLPSRTEPGETKPFSEWLAKRMESLSQAYGLKK